MAAFVEMNQNSILLDFDQAAGFDELSIELFGSGFVEAAQLPGQSAVAAIGQDGQHHIEIDVEPDFAGQTVEMKKVDADADAVLDTVAGGIAQNEIAAGEIVPKVDEMQR